MKERIGSKEELIQNCLRFYAFSESLTPEDVAFYRSKLKNTKRFVVISLDGGHHVFTPGGYASYSGMEGREDWLAHTIDVSRHHSRNYLDRHFAEYLVKEGHPLYETLVHAYQSHCAKWGVTPSKENARGRDFWFLSDVTTRQASADEIDEEETYIEGAKRQVTINAYERDPAARAACLAHYGNRYRCEVCEFDFQATYGAHGKDFIHVHHLVPLHTITASYEVKATDLIPLCCNCHAMIHRYKKLLLEPKDLKAMMAKQRSGA